MFTSFLHALITPDLQTMSHTDKLMSSVERLVAQLSSPSSVATDFLLHRTAEDVA